MKQLIPDNEIKIQIIGDGYIFTNRPRYAEDRKHNDIELCETVIEIMSDMKKKLL